jgi:hypothetical protein
MCNAVSCFYILNHCPRLQDDSRIFFGPCALVCILSAGRPGLAIMGALRAVKHGAGTEQALSCNLVLVVEPWVGTGD